MRPVSELVRTVAPFEVVVRLLPVGRPAHGHRRPRAADPGGGEGRRPARRHRHRQVGDHGLARRAAAAADARPRAEQDARRPARQRVPRAAAQQRRRVLRLLLRLLPARGLRPADGHLHREGLLDQRGGRAAPALGDQQPAHPARRDRRRERVLHLRPRHPAGIPRPQRQPPRRRHDRARRSCCGCSSTCSTRATTWRSPGARSGCAATRSRSSRSTRSTPSGSRCSATRSSGS